MDLPYFLHAFSSDGYLQLFVTKDLFIKKTFCTFVAVGKEFTAMWTLEKYH